MKVYKRNFMRPHTDAPWFTPSDKFKTWIKTNYEDTGKCTKFREMSYDDSSELTMTLESHWDDSSASDMANILASSEWQESLTNTVFIVFLLLSSTSDMYDASNCKPLSSEVCSRAFQAAH